MKLYNELAEHYFDIETPGRRFEDEVNFLDEIFKKHKIKSVLDLGCGTGEHVLAMQSRGYQILGIDSSEEMITIAKKRFPHCKFTIANMASYQSPHSFDGAICMFGSFNYLLQEEDLEKTFKQLQKNLKQAGLVVFEIWNAEPIRKIKRKAISNVASIKSGTVNIKRNRGFRMTRSDVQTIVEVNYIYNINQKEIRDRHVMRAFSQQEIKVKFEEYKFEVIHLYGSYTMEKFKPSGGRMIYVLKKKS